MNNFITVESLKGKLPALPSLDLCELPAKLSKRLWIEPGEMVQYVQALVLAEWAIRMSKPRQALPIVAQRGRKTIYRESSILVMALIQVAWQMSYEDVVDYL